MFLICLGVSSMQIEGFNKSVHMFIFIVLFGGGKGKSNEIQLFPIQRVVNVRVWLEQNPSQYFQPKQKGFPVRELWISALLVNDIGQRSMDIAWILEIWIKKWVPII